MVLWGRSPESLYPTGSSNWLFGLEVAMDTPLTVTPAQLRAIADDWESKGLDSCRVVEYRTGDSVVWVFGPTDDERARLQPQVLPVPIPALSMEGHDERKTNGVTFYTLTIDPPVTLCEECALAATERGLDQCFDTITDALTEFSLCMAAIGDPTDITSSDVGPCENPDCEN